MALNADSPANTCPGCGATFTCHAALGCGMAAGVCWCSKLPPLSGPLPEAGCYCPACLKQAVYAALPGSSS